MSNKQEQRPEIKREEVEGWYCHNCDIELIPERVTYGERCDTCGHPAKWIESSVIVPQSVAELESYTDELQRENERFREGLEKISRHKNIGEQSNSFHYLIGIADKTLHKQEESK